MIKENSRVKMDRMKQILEAERSNCMFVNKMVNATIYKFL